MNIRTATRFHCKMIGDLSVKDFGTHFGTSQFFGTGTIRIKCRSRSSLPCTFCHQQRHDRRCRRWCRKNCGSLLARSSSYSACYHRACIVLTWLKCEVLIIVGHTKITYDCDVHGVSACNKKSYNKQHHFCPHHFLFSKHTIM